VRPELGLDLVGTGRGHVDRERLRLEARGADGDQLLAGREEDRLRRECLICREARELDQCSGRRDRERDLGEAAVRDRVVDVGDEPREPCGVRC